MEINQLKELLIANYHAKEDMIQSYEITVSQLSFLKLRDIIISDLGKIDFEDLENQLYIAIIPGGILKKNSGVAVFNLNENLLKIAIYSREGIIQQNTSEDILNEIKKAIQKFTKK